MWRRRWELGEGAAVVPFIAARARASGLSSGVRALGWDDRETWQPSGTRVVGPPLGSTAFDRERTGGSCTEKEKKMEGARRQTAPSAFSRFLWLTSGPGGDGCTEACTRERDAVDDSRVMRTRGGVAELPRTAHVR